MATKKTNAPVANQEKFLVVYDCCSDPVKLCSTLDTAKKFVMGLITTGAGNECCEDNAVPATQVKVYRVLAVASEIKVEVNFT